MADILQDQFTSLVTRTLRMRHVKSPDFESPTIKKPFNEYDFLKAICDIKSDLTCGPDGIPVIR